MITLLPPRPARVEQLFRDLESSSFSYPEVGATRGEIPTGYAVDDYATELGQGDAVFLAARQAVIDWVPFRLRWVRARQDRPLQEGCQVAVMARVLGTWWTNVSRVVYVVDEPDTFGFAYGTLHPHAESGEELFRVVRSPESGIVRYEIRAFSRPAHFLVRWGYPLARRVQRAFGRGSLAAMKRAVADIGEG